MTKNELNPQPKPFWKSQIIKILRGTIGLLETAIVKLETEYSSDTDKNPNLLNNVQVLWSIVLEKIRSLLPANLGNSFSDTTLTGVLVGITVIVFWTTSTIFHDKSTKIATSPTPAPTPVLSPTPEKIIPAPTPTPEETIPTPTPTPTPTPVLELTPEQTLIAAIENQVGEVTNRFASGLILSVKANFRTSDITLKISDDWYTLKEPQQNNLAAEILQRSQQLDFTHLEILDSQGRLVARSPVIGNEMIIFQRDM